MTMDSEGSMPGTSAMSTAPSTMELGGRYFVLFDDGIVLYTQPLLHCCLYARAVFVVELYFLIAKFLSTGPCRRTYEVFRCLLFRFD